ncbi:hypothetical protein SBRCBS47491_007923 [Sporothrix bragantina]|uniref:Uncharacterized protein n=1 Tax=Sporothrix bragantina TaxID=671064 RepID=A0ABP0CJQ3_9PEZI
MDFFRRKDGECESAADDRFPMILITGLPAVGKTTVARELAYLLEESNSKRLNGNQPEPGLQEAAWAFFKNYRRGSASSDNSYQPGPSNCHRREHSSPVEYFARRKATVVNVDHFSYMEGMRERHMSGPDSKRLMPPEPLIRTAGEIWWYCMSLASLQSKRQADPESIRRLDRGRRLAIESYVMPESEKESAIILTECLYGDGRNGKSETVAVAYKTAAEVFDRRLIPIYLTCNAHEHQRRFECRQRDAQKNLEGISDPAITYRIPYKDAMVLRQEGLDKVSASIKNRAKANGGSLYYFSKPADYQDGKYSVITEGREFSFEPVDLLHKNQGCRIDTTGLSASEVASIIQRFCEDVMRGMPLQTLKGWESSAPPPEGDGEKDTNGDGKQRKQNRPGNENMFIN